MSHRIACFFSIFIALTTCVVAQDAAPKQPSATIQFPDLKSLPDSSADLQSQLDANGGNLILKQGVYRLTKGLHIDLEKHGAVAVKAENGAVTLIMDGAGPAIRIAGSHQGTAGPTTFKPETWHQRMPIVEGIEIIGNHPQADGIELFQTVGAIVSKTAVRWCRHGITLATRNRNVAISDCHLYENSGIGIYLDDVNLHQINISNSHVSYNRGGGIVVRDGSVRNLQITGCDIEANMPADETPTKTANVWIDLSGSKGDKTKSIAEIAITGCSIQHSGNRGEKGNAKAPGGANIRLSGKPIAPIDSVTISGNVMSDVTVGIEIDHSMDVAISGNTLFTPQSDFMTVTNSQRVVVTGNTFNPRDFERPGTIRFSDCRDCIFSNSVMHDFQTEDGAVILENCAGMSLSGLILTDCKSGILVKGGKDNSIENCKVRGLPEGVEAIVRQP